MNDVALWYHTIDLGDGRVTPGWFDLRPVVDRIPWPDLTGKRCLDVGTYDGFLAFEMERRGASEVVCTDVPGHEHWDWLPRARVKGPEELATVAGPKGRGFEVAADALGSSVVREWINVYDLSPERLGTFDVVTCGALLLHLREPLRALEAVRGITDGSFVSIEQVDPLSSLVFPRRPMTFIRGERGQWTIPNVAGHKQMLEIAGFDVVASARFAEPFGVAHPRPRPVGSRAWRQEGHRALAKQMFRGEGLPSSALRATVAVRPPVLSRELL